MSKLSIIVPVYNVKDYLERCINSILNQAFKDFELILVDDGSTDGSGDLCEVFKRRDPRIIVIHQDNKGQSHARNIGIKKATGNYIGFVDSDDWIEADMFDEMMKTAESQDAEIVVCRLQKVDTAGNVLEVIGPKETITMDWIEATKEILKDEEIPSFPWNKLFKRILFDGIEFPVGRIFEDTATIYKLFYKANKVIAISYIGYNYLQNPNSTCNIKHVDPQKYLNRELYNALAFDERYVFAKSTKELEDIVPLCAFKAYQMIRSFIHMLAHKKYILSTEQETIVDNIMSSFDSKDLTYFSAFQKMDLHLYRYCKPLLKAYLNIIPLFHKMKE